MSSFIRLSESTIEQIRAEQDERVVVRFSPAVLIRSEGIAGVDSSSRWHQSMELLLQEAEQEGEAPALPARPEGGSMECGGYKYVDMVPVPLQGAGFAQLKLSFPDLPELVITGQEASLAMQGQPRYVEHIDEAPSGG